MPPDGFFQSFLGIIKAQICAVAELARPPSLKFKQLRSSTVVVVFLLLVMQLALAADEDTSTTLDNINTNTDIEWAYVIGSGEKTYHIKSHAENSL